MMPLPYSLQQSVEQAYTALAKHSRHELRPFFRWPIYRAILGLGEPFGHRMRGALALLTARHVLPIWQNERPHDHLPERILARADQVLAGRVPAEIGAHEALLFENRADEDFPDVDWSSISLPALFVLDAAVAALYEASRVYRFSGEEEGKDPIYDPESSGDADDDELDYTSTDPAGWASYAYAGGTWDSEFEPAKSKEFWEWWLTVAIPEAWRIAGNEGAT